MCIINIFFVSKTAERLDVILEVSEQYCTHPVCKFANMCYLLHMRALQLNIFIFILEKRLRLHDSTVREQVFLNAVARRSISACR